MCHHRFHSLDRGDQLLREQGTLEQVVDAKADRAAVVLVGRVDGDEDDVGVEPGGADALDEIESIQRASGSADGFCAGGGGSKTRQCFEPAVCSTETGGLGLGLWGEGWC